MKLWICSFSFLKVLVYWHIQIEMSIQLKCWRHVFTTLFPSCGEMTKWNFLCHSLILTFTVFFPQSCGHLPLRDIDHPILWDDVIITRSWITMPILFTYLALPWCFCVKQNTQQKKKHKRKNWGLLRRFWRGVKCKYIKY